MSAYHRSRSFSHLAHDPRLIKSRRLDQSQNIATLWGAHATRRPPDACGICKEASLPEGIVSQERNIKPVAVPIPARSSGWTCPVFVERLGVGSV